MSRCPGAEPALTRVISVGFVAWPGLASTWVVEQHEQLKLSLCRCKKKVSATKRFTIHRAPRVLTLALKRFADFTGGKITKVSAQQSRAGLCPVPRPCCPEQGGRWFCARCELYRSPAALPQLCCAVVGVWLIPASSSPWALPGESGFSLPHETGLVGQLSCSCHLLCRLLRHPLSAGRGLP